MDLRADGIVKVCQFLYHVAVVNQIVETGRDLNRLSEIFQRASLTDFNHDLTSDYLSSLRVALASKRGDFCPLLNHTEIQDVIDAVNEEKDNAQSLETIEAVRLVNQAVRTLDASQLFLALSNPNLALSHRLEKDADNEVVSLKEVDALHYLQVSY